MRGAASVSAGNDPLIIVDGFPISAVANGAVSAGDYDTGSADNILGSINPNDIESIEVLKDASSTAIHVFTEMTTDIGDCQWDDDVWNDLRKVNFTSNSEGAIAAYSKYINFISKMTLTMDRISKIDMDETEKARLMAELHCGRGWLAYILYDLYGPIQVASKELLEDPLNDNPAPRLSQEQMVKFIEDDLKAALVLPARYDKNDSKYGRFTRGLVYTVLMTSLTRCSLSVVMSFGLRALAVPTLFVMASISSM